MNIIELDEFRSKLNDIKEACNFLPDMSSKEGYDKSKRVALDVGKVLTAIEKVRKDKKAYFIKGGKEVDLQAKKLVAEIEEYSLQHKEAYKKLDAEKKEREANRVAMLEDRVAYIRDIAESMRDMHSSEILCAMEQMNAEQCDNFFEFTESALKARNASRAALAKLYTDTLEKEKNDAELEVLRKEKAERDAKEHDERVAREAIESAKAKEEAENLRIENEKLKRQQDREHVGNIRRQAKESLMATGITEEQAKTIVLAINNGEITNVTIGY